MNLFKHSLLITIFSLVAITLKSQVSTSYLSENDSLKGFDEKAVINYATLHGAVGADLKKQIFIAKKEFIHEKYFHNHSKELIWEKFKVGSVMSSCTNVDFEAGSLAGWTLSSGINTNSTLMAGCCPTSGGISTVLPSSGNDPIAGSLLPLASPFGGSNIARVNNSATGALVERISQTFNVTSSNAIFQIAYAGVLEAAGHACVDQPYINISVIDSSGNVLGCPNIVIQAPSSSCTQPASVTAGWNQLSSGPYYHTWEIKTIDLSPYIGTAITIQITVGDCAQTGHFGYGYFDCQCLPLEITLNTIVYDATPQTPINLSTCGALTASITAPTGLNPYTWNGPPSSGITNITTQGITTTVSATYTLVMDPPGSCFGPVTKYIILNSSPNPTLTNVTAQATCTNATGSGTINVASGTAPFNYNWLPAASTGSIATGLSPGTDYTVTVVDTFGCQNVTVVSIASFTDAPTYTISPLSANLSCLSNSVLVSATTASNTTAVWTHTTSSNFTVTTAGSYSCVVTNTVSLCTATVPITITSNTIAPVANFSLTCSTSLVSLNASSSGGVALGWLAPTSPVSAVSNPGTSSATGIFTLTATNLTTGCKTTYTIESTIPSINVTLTPTTNVLTCTTPSIQVNSTSPSSGVIFTWSDATSTNTASVFTVTTPGTYTAMVAAPGGCSTQSVITISSNTTAAVNIISTSTVIPCSTNSLTLNANTFGGPYTYIWLPSVPSATNNAYSVSDAGVYSVLVLNTTNGCTATATQTVSHESVTASFDANPTSGLMPLAVSFTNTSVNIAGTSYSWDLGNSATTYTINNPSTIYNVQGSFPVVLTATNGFCQDTAVKFIHVELVSFFTVPNVFTPNGDGKNDIFTFDAINMGEINLTIFDRWGLKMFDITGSGNVKWDGKNKGGSVVSDGTYFYIIKATGLDNQKYDLQGTVNVFQ